MADAPGSLSATRPTRRATVCQVLHSLNVGGTEVLAARLARRLAERYNFLFACLDDLGPLGEQLQNEGFLVEVLERRPGFDRRCARRLRALCGDCRVDLLHAHQYTPFSYALASGLLRRRPPVLFSEHGRWHPDVRRLRRVAFNRLFLRRGDRVAAVSQAVRRALIDNEGLPAERIRVIYNGIDPIPYQHPQVARDEVRRSLQFDDGDFVIIQVARLDALKDHCTAIRALARLVRHRPGAKLLLVGEGAERPAIESEIARLRVGGQVRMLGLRSDVAELLQVCDAFLLTSVSEGLPLTIIEAMAAGLPVVSTEVGGVPELVTAETALLAPPGDAAALADALLQLADGADLARRLGEAGRRRAVEQFSEQRNHEQYCRLYEEMLGG